jgi:hypothetical protein
LGRSLGIFDGTRALFRHLEDRYHRVVDKMIERLDNNWRHINRNINETLTNTKEEVSAAAASSTSSDVNRRKNIGRKNAQGKQIFSH